MPKILVDKMMISLMPDFIEQVERIVGKTSIKKSLLSEVKELYFDYKNFKEHEVVVGRVTTRDRNLNVTSINSTETYFVHYV